MSAGAEEGEAEPSILAGEGHDGRGGDSGDAADSPPGAAAAGAVPAGARSSRGGSQRGGSAAVATAETLQWIPEFAEAEKPRALTAALLSADFHRQSGDGMSWPFELSDELTRFRLAPTPIPGQHQGGFSVTVVDM